jgi:hypothetical protein
VARSVAKDLFIDVLQNYETTSVDGNPWAQRPRGMHPVTVSVR